MFGRMKDPVRGTARLVSYEETNMRNEFDTTIVAQVIMEGEGVAPTAVESRIGVRNSELPLPSGTTWDVEFERDDPKHFKTIERDEQTVEAEHAAAKQQAQQLAAQMRSGAAPTYAFGPTLTGIPRIVDLSGGADPARVQQAMAKVQQMFGVDLSGAAAAAAATAQPAGAAATGTPAATTDDTIDRLERLGALHTSGVLTGEEFAAQKAKILAG
jgi:hypothetical protein